MESKESTRLLELASIIGFISITIAAFLAWDSPARHYESSIYDSTPALTWILLAVTASIGVGIVVFQLYSEKKRTPSWMIYIGLILVVLSSITIFSMPVIRGYFFFNATGDSGIHLALAKDLLISGRIGAQDFYPVAAIETVSISALSNVGIMYVQKELPILLALLSTLFIYYFSYRFLQSKNQAIAVTLVSLALINNFGIIFAPFQLTNFLLPFALYLIVRGIMERSYSWLISMSLVIFLFPAAHIVPSMFLIIFILAIGSLRKDSLEGYGFSGIRFGKGAILTATVLAILIVSWISSFYIWAATIENLVILINEGKSTYLDYLLEYMNYASGHGYDLISYFLKMYGNMAAYFLISICIYLIIWRHQNRDRETRNITALYFPLFFALIAMVILYFASLPFGPTRLLVYASIMSFIPIGFGICKFLFWAKSRSKILSRLTVTLVMIFVLVTLASGSAALYPSPYTLSPNYQYTYSEATGMTWYLEKKDRDMNSSSWYFSPWIEAKFLLSNEERLNRDDLSRQNVIPFPDHFGYDKGTLLGQYYKNDGYLVVKEMLKRIYIDVYPEMAPYRLEQSDFVELEFDSSIDRIHSNGGMDIYYIQGLLD